MSILVKTQATIYPDMISVYIPNELILKDFTATKSFRKNIHNSDLQEELEFDEESPIERSIRRTKKQIKDYVLCNQFALFATFTFRDNRYDIDEKRKQMSNWFKNQQKRNGGFQYLAIPELHADGALHFHALLTDYPGRIEEAINPKTNKRISKYGQIVYYFPEYTLGFSNFRLLNQSTEDHLKVAVYVSKYITKDMPIFNGKKRYFCSQGLLRPILIDNPTNWYEKLKPDWHMETKNGTILRFLRGNSSIVDDILRSYDG